VIQSTQDVAFALVAAARSTEPTDEAQFSEPLTAAGLVPPQTVFTVATVEGRRYIVTVREEQP
jgi:hypothetical protein